MITKSTITLTILLTAASALFLGGCTQANGPEILKTADNAPVGTAMVKMRTTAAGGPFSKIADSAVVTISASDIVTMVRPLNVTDSTVEGTISGIPSGKDRLFEVSVFDSNKTLQYTGSGRTDVVADTLVHLPISVIRVRGDVSINGSIIEGEEDLFSALVAYYPFNGNTLDNSGFRNDATPYGAVLTTDRLGRTDNAYHFNGTSAYIETPYRRSLDCEDMATVTLWAKSDIPGSGYTNTGTILQMGSGSEAAYAIGLNPNHSLYVIQFDFCGHWTTPEATDRASLDAAIINGHVRNGPTLDTLWHFYAFTFDGDTLRGYVDGEPVGAKNALAGPITDLPLRIGAQSKSLDNFWKGKIDDVRIFHRALAPQEIIKIKTLNN